VGDLAAAFAFGRALDDPTPGNREPGVDDGDAGRALGQLPRPACPPDKSASLQRSPRTSPLILVRLRQRVHPPPQHGRRGHLHIQRPAALGSRHDQVRVQTQEINKRLLRAGQVGQARRSRRLWIIVVQLPALHAEQPRQIQQVTRGQFGPGRDDSRQPAFRGHTTPRRRPRPRCASTGSGDLEVTPLIVVDENFDDVIRARVDNARSSPC
jgi:hypothetical protein